MHDLDSIIGQHFGSLTRRVGDWVVTLDPGFNLTIGCLWRLLENSHIRFTSLDDGHKFGLPKPVDAEVEVNHRIAGAQIVSVELFKGTLDLTLVLSTGHAFQVVPDSSGYESWQFNRENTSLVAQGGGNLWASSPEGG